MLAASATVDVDWFGNNEAYDGSTSGSWIGVEGVDEVNERTEAAEDPDGEDIDIVTVGGRRRGTRATWEKKEHGVVRGASHNIANTKTCTPGGICG